MAAFAFVPSFPLKSTYFEHSPYSSLLAFDKQRLYALCSSFSISSSCFRASFGLYVATRFSVIVNCIFYWNHQEMNKKNHQYIPLFYKEYVHSDLLFLYNRYQAAAISFLFQATVYMILKKITIMMF